MFSFAIRERSLYFDKTLLIKKFLQSKDKLMLITYPSQWARTTNIDMLQSFLSFDIHKDKISENIINSRNYKLFHDPFATQLNNDKIWSKLKILNHTDIMETYFGQYPVITLSLGDFYLLKSDELSRYFYTMQFVKMSIANSLHKYRFIFNELASTQNNDKSKIHSTMSYIFSNYEDKVCLADRDGYKIENDSQMIVKSIKLATQVLHEHFNKKVFVFIDGYEHLLTGDFEGPLFGKYKIYVFLKNLINETFHKNDHIEKGLICGTIPLEESFFEGLDIQKYCYPRDNEYYNYFSLSKEEMNAPLAPFDMNADFFCSYFGGYKLLNSKETLTSIDLVIQDLTKKENSVDFRLPWMFPLYFLSNDIIRRRMLAIVYNKKENCEFLFFKKSFNLWELDVIYSMLRSSKLDRFNKQELNLFFNFLLFYGYLTFQVSEQGPLKTLTMPNCELESFFIKCLNE
jgi:hypothetical protein